ncbi:exodeoxyribonuclease V subunit alpha [Candidatus Profftia tarda]|nr:exodeoxyribonuclease V subunit alpha [Candidatus Profftia tarda]
MIFDLLLRMKEHNYLRSLDIHFARLMASNGHPHLALASALVSKGTSAGHVCLPLSQLSIETLVLQFPYFSSDMRSFFGSICEKKWQDLLLSEPEVSDGSYMAPMILQYSLLYLQRSWRDECCVAKFFATSYFPLYYDEQYLSKILAHLFPPRNSVNAINWQKVAVGVAAMSKVSIILGGPGTGKTTTVTKLLTALIQLYPYKKLRIQLAAPTGKAAARLTETLGVAINMLNLDIQVRQSLPQEAYTLHRLLGAQYNNARFRYYQDNPLRLDVLVVDEASMVDLSMMSKIISAIPKDARLILLGDRNQLLSVESGSILGDLCYFAKFGFRPARARSLSILCQYSITEGNYEPDIAIRDSICLLKKNYRFKVNSGIAQLATAVNSGDAAHALKLLNKKFTDISWIPMTKNKDYDTLIQTCVEGYRSTLELVYDRADITKVFTSFSRFRLLCALREGLFGQSGLNERIELALAKAKLIKRSSQDYRNWYSGKPIMLTRNDSSLGLFNGDIGISLAYPAYGIRVYFQLSDGSIKSVHPSCLPQVDTAYAMTVHKSQGSEFAHAILVLPVDFSAIVTRELLYTAITRAKQKITIFSKDKILVSAICTPTLRQSGFIKRIMLES